MGAAPPKPCASACGMLCIPPKSLCDFAQPRPKFQQKLTLNADVFSTSRVENVDFIRLGAERNLFTYCLAAQTR